MARIADVEIGDTGFDKEAREFVGKAKTNRDLQVLRKLVSLQGDKMKLAELTAKVEKAV